jgi:catechol 2,3-dioxygenase-like lactoylglutathione lyase family enzyme
MAGFLSPMLASTPIVAFVAITDREQARAFYVDVLGLKLRDEDAFALMLDAGGTMLRLALVETLQPQGFTVLGWIVPDIAAAVRDLGARGVAFKRYEFMQQDDLGIWAAPGGARVAWFADPFGNTLSLTQSA